MTNEYFLFKGISSGRNMNVKKIIQFFYLPIIAQALVFSSIAHSVMWHYDLTEVVSVVGDKIILKEVGRLDYQLYPQFEMKGLMPMLCFSQLFGKITSDGYLELECAFINSNVEEENETSGVFLTYLSALFNTKEVKTDPPSEYPTISQGDIL